MKEKMCQEWTRCLRNNYDNDGGDDDDDDWFGEYVPDLIGMVL